MPIRTESGLKLTYEDYAKIPADGRRHEIIDGRHVVNPAPRPRHQVILGNLFLALQELKSSGRAELLMSPIDLHLTEIDVVQPDLIAIARKSAKLIGELKIEGPPELVVEILSPSTRRLDRGAKRALYESAGVAEYWTVDPEEKTLCQHTLAEGRYSEKLWASGRVASTAFPGFSFDLVSIF
ncbi:MAG: Uma2 family endonuclease [Planctomycetota bacterium]|jgi:Uma2 family endonuclease